MNVWAITGQEALRDGRIAMFFLGNYGETQLQSWAPQTKGKWRVISLPFGANGLDGSLVLAISKNSKHKELA